MKPSVALDQKRSAVRGAASRFRTVNTRVFGSTLHGNDHDGSDLELRMRYPFVLRFGRNTAASS